jgi:hypothetical protein
VAFLVSIGAFLAAGTAIAASDTASGIQNSTTPASGSNTTSSVQNSATSQLQFFPPAAYGSPCSPGAPVVAWNGAGSGKGTYCITLPICATGQILTTVADGNGNPSFTCAAIAPDSTADDGLGTTTSGTDLSSSTSAGTGGSTCSFGVVGGSNCVAPPLSAATCPEITDGGGLGACPCTSWTTWGSGAVPGGCQTGYDEAASNYGYDVTCSRQICQ